MTQESKIVEVENSVMSVQEARQCLVEIQTHITSIRLLLVDLDRRRGWEALGYKSMRQCLKAELEGKTGKSISQLYRELNAGKIEHELSHYATDLKIGTIPERHLEPLNQLPPEQWHLAWQVINETAPSSGVTRTHVLDTVAKIKGRSESASNDSQDSQDKIDTPNPSNTSAERFTPPRDRKTEAENSFYNPGDMVMVACGAGVPLEWRRWNGYWGVVRSIGHSAGSIEVVVGGSPVRYKASDLEPIDNPDEGLKTIATTVNRLLKREDLDESERFFLENWYCNRLVFSQKSLEILDFLANRYKE